MTRQDFIARAAIAAMQGLLANPSSMPWKGFHELCFKHAGDLWDERQRRIEKEKLTVDGDTSSLTGREARGA